MPRTASLPIQMQGRPHRREGGLDVQRPGGWTEARVLQKQRGGWWG